MNHSTLGEAALQLAHRGWAVFPVAPRGKTPLTKNGLKDASTDLGLVKAWWSVRPNGNVGVNCGASGLLVVDLDGEAAVRAWTKLAAEKGGHQPILVARTGMGFHAYFLGDGPSPAGRVARHIDTRGRGGYVICPPSVHGSGRRYEWLDASVEPVPAPWWLLEALDKGSPEVSIGEARSLPWGKAYTPYGRAAVHALVEEMSSTPEGERNDTLNALAYRCGRLAGGGQLAHDVARLLLVRAALDAGLDPEEADATFTSGFDAGLARPVSLEGHA